MSTRSMDQQFAGLTRDIDWQRATFLCNCLEIVCPPDTGPLANSPAEIIVRGLLDHYLLLALLYYRQLRTDLKQQFKANKLHKEDVKICLQRGLDRLVEEWDRVFHVISSVRASHSAGKAMELMKTVHPVQHAAHKDAHLSTNFQSVLHFNQDYAMRFFSYIENVAALNMPLAAVESPWEWTILWHELAHEKILSIKRVQPDYFKEMLAGIVKEAGVGTPAQIRKLGWSADWLEEMFADSFSVVNFPIHFLFILKYQLERYADGGGVGSTHPFISVRLATAMFFHLQRKGIALPLRPGLQDWEAKQWRTTWSELADPREKRPQRFASFDPNNLLRVPKFDRQQKAMHLAMTSVAAQKMLDWHNEQARVNPHSSSIRDLIAQAMKEYSYGQERSQIFSDMVEGIRSLGDARIEYEGQYTVDQRLKEIEDVVTSKTIPDNESILNAFEMEYAGIARLLRVKGDLITKLGYRELLALEFDADAYDKSSVTVSNVQVLSNGKWNDKFSSAVLVAPIVDVNKGQVAFKHPSATDLYQVSTVAWNKASKQPDYKIGE